MHFASKASTGVHESLPYVERFLSMWGWRRLSRAAKSALPLMQKRLGSQRESSEIPSLILSGHKQPRRKVASPLLLDECHRLTS
jgi:hypothetical protein